MLSAVDVYRHQLATQPDRSVAISSIGLLTNLGALLRSPPDRFSLLSGRALVASKVRLVVIMGGTYPTSGGRGFCNFWPAFDQGKDVGVASAAAAFVVSQLPPEVRVIFSGVSLGKSVQSGAALSSCTPAGNPCRQAYIDYLGGEGRSRSSWDPLTTLVAVRGAAAGCSDCVGCDGANTVNASTGANAWTSGDLSNHSYLVLHDADAAGAEIDSLLCRPPSRTPGAIKRDAPHSSRDATPMAGEAPFGKPPLQ